MKFVEICDFIINSQEVKYINFGFTPEITVTRNAEKKARELRDKAILHLSELAGTTNTTEFSEAGEGTITIVFNNYERIVIKKATNSTDFKLLKSSILLQLNQAQTIN